LKNTSVSRQKFSVKTGSSQRPDVSKECNACDEDKELRFFYVDRKAPDGRQSICKACRAERRKDEEGYTNATSVVRNIPCEDGCWNGTKCARETLTCEAFRQWIKTGRKNTFSRIPDRSL
jgi:hypothetical protein